MKEYEEARDDYEAALAADLQSPEILLGAGIRYAQLGEIEKAKPLLQYGIELLGEPIPKLLTPQVAGLRQIAEWTLLGN